MTSSTTTPDSVSRKDPTELRAPGMIIGAVIIVVLLIGVAFALDAVKGIFAGGAPAPAASASPQPEGFGAWVSWTISDITSPQFYKLPLASIGLFLGAALAWWAWKHGRAWGGIAVSYGSGLWPWILGSATLSLILSNVAFGWRIDDTWQSTFIPFVCVPAAIVLIYGSGWKTLFTGAVLGAGIATPLSIPLIMYVTVPLGLPGVAANTMAMALGTAISCLIARYLPWMERPAAPKQDAAPAAPATTITGTPTLWKDAAWTMRRVIADFSEAQFWATELASIGMLIGLAVTVMIGPAELAGLLPQILVAQGLTAAIGVVVWRRGLRGGGYVPTYIPVVSVAPACVLAFGGTVPAIILGAVLGALIGPFISRLIEKILPSDFHPVIAFTFAMAVTSAIVVPTLGLILN